MPLRTIDGGEPARIWVPRPHESLVPSPSPSRPSPNRHPAPDAGSQDGACAGDCRIRSGRKADEMDDVMGIDVAKDEVVVAQRPGGLLGRWGNTTPAGRP